jgi:hypothetical protein
MLKVIEGRTGPTRRSTLEPYLDSYLNLTVKLDNAAFPTEPTVQTTIPDYVPDGLVDYGRSFPSKREPIVVDKRAILEKNKPILTEIFSRDYTGMNEVQIKTAMVSALTEHVYTSMPYGDKSVDQGGNLSEATETLCRHHALTLQVLCQTIGVESRLFKGELNGSGHGANFVRLGGKWWLVDATQPDFSRAANGSEQWNPAAFEVEGPPYQGTRVYNVHSRYGGPDRQYIAADRMNWTIR